MPSFYSWKINYFVQIISIEFGLEPIGTAVYYALSDLKILNILHQTIVYAASVLNLDYTYFIWGFGIPSNIFLNPTDAPTII
jgi:hypothetical protein